MDFATFLVQCLNAVQYGLLLFLVASGLTLIFGTLGVVNFAHGAMIILGAYATYYLNALTGWSPFVLVIFDGIIVAAIGAILYLGYLRYTTNSALVRMFALIGFSSVVVAGLLVSTHNLALAAEQVVIFVLLLVN